MVLLAAVLQAKVANREFPPVVCLGYVWITRVVLTKQSVGPESGMIFPFSRRTKKRSSHYLLVGFVRVLLFLRPQHVGLGVDGVVLT